MVDDATRQKWHVARLISAAGIRGADEQEVRATAALLSVMAAVPEFGRAITSRLGAPAGRLTTYTEVEFKGATGSKVRPDGALVVERGSTKWLALVEVKTGTNELRRDQVEGYLDVARDEGMNCVVTISNQIAGSSSGLPVDVDRRKVRRVHLAHLSWLEVLTEAAFQHEHRGVADPDQAYILGELIRYLEDHRSGAMTFEDMGPQWVTVRDGARDGTLRAADASVQDVAGRWDQLLQFLALDLGRELGAPVRQVLSRKERDDPSARRGYLIDLLVRNATLDGVLRIPGAVGDVSLSASLRSKLVSSQISIGAADDRKPLTKVRWLLRQLANAPASVRIDVAFQGTRQTVAALLKDAREDESKLLLDPRSDPRLFTLTLTAPMGERRDNHKGAFIESMDTLLERFYGEVAQSLRPWQVAPPKLKPVDDSTTEDLDVTPLEAPTSRGVDEVEQLTPLGGDPPTPDRLDSTPVD